MGRACCFSSKRQETLTLVVVAVTFLAFLPLHAAAQQQPCPFEVPGAAITCQPDLPSNFQATPLIDGNGTMSYGDSDNNIVSLYGVYGNDESYNPGGGLAPAYNHYLAGLAAAQAIQPLCTDGTTNCPASQRAIVFLFIGFSNCDIEICGGNADIWDNQGQHPRYAGQPCATTCPNPNTLGQQPWNDAGDGVTQKSFLYQVDEKSALTWSCSTAHSGHKPWVPGTQMATTKIPNTHAFISRCTTLNATTIMCRQSFRRTDIPKNRCRSSSSSLPMAILNAI